MKGGKTIFIAKNEKGEPSWKLILEGKKTVTRRVKPLPVGKEFAVQPGRGKFAVCRGKVIFCMHHRDWIKSQSTAGAITLLGIPYFNKEARKEGFESWDGLVKWFNTRGQDIETMFRIEFEKIDTNIPKPEQ